MTFTPAEIYGLAMSAFFGAFLGLFIFCGQIQKQVEAPFMNTFSPKKESASGRPSRLKRLPGPLSLFVVVLLASLAWAGTGPRSWYQDARWSMPELRLEGPVERVGAGVDGFHFPHFYSQNGNIYAVYINSYGGCDLETGLAFSTNGRDFFDTGKIIERDRDFDIHQAAFADLWRTEDGVWHVVYEAKSYGLGEHDGLPASLFPNGDWISIAYTTSTDLITWVKHGPILAGSGHMPGHIAQWWAGQVTRCADIGFNNVGTPTLFKEGQAWHLYFHGFDFDGRCRIYHASGPDLRRLTISPGPLIDVEQDPTALGGGTIGWRSRVWKRAGLYWMAYEVSTFNGGDFKGARWGIQIARAQHPEGPWFKQDKVLLINPDPGFGYDGPDWLRIQGQDWLYFRGPDGGTYRVRLHGLPPGADDV